MGEGMRHPREFGGSRIRSGWMTAAIVMCLAFAISACSGSIPAEAQKNMIAASAVSADTQNYVLNPGDELQITVWKEEGLDQKVLVRPDGMISFPLAGHIRAAGQTTQQVQAVIRRRIAPYIADPQVNVSVTGTTGYKVYATGQIQRPGTYSSPQPMTVLQLLALAGGLTPFGDEDTIIIVRKIGEKQRFIPFNYSKAKRGIDLDQNIILQSGDVVVVRE